MSGAESDWNRFLRRFGARLQEQNSRIQNAQIAQTMEISQINSMQNRLIRDVINLSNRVQSLERIAAYRTKHSDDEDPLKRVIDSQNSNTDQN